MRVEIEDEVFAVSGSSDVEIISIIASHLRRHRIGIIPSFRLNGNRNINKWLANQTAHIREAAQAVLSYGLRAPSYSNGATSEFTVRIGARINNVTWHSDVNSPRVNMPLSQASTLLSMPLYLLLENGRNDWRFIEKIVPETWKATWKLAKERRWIENGGGGGIDELRRWIEVNLSEDYMRRIRTWIMFDNDGHHEGDESASARSVREICEDYRIPYWELKRRAIENYIPLASLFDWAARRRPIGLQKAKIATAQAFASIFSDEQRNFYNLKGGFRAESVMDPIYLGLPSTAFSVLVDGFHQQIAQHIWGDGDDQHEYHITETSLRTSKFDSERESIFQSIFSCL